MAFAGAYVAVAAAVAALASPAAAAACGIDVGGKHFELSNAFYGQYAQAAQPAARPALRPALTMGARPTVAPRDQGRVGARGPVLHRDAQCLPQAAARAPRRRLRGRRDGLH